MIPYWPNTGSIQMIIVVYISNVISLYLTSLGYFPILKEHIRGSCAVNHKKGRQLAVRPALSVCAKNCQCGFRHENTRDIQGIVASPLECYSG